MRMKMISIIVSPMIEKISVALVLEVITRKVSSDRRFSQPLYGLSDSDPVIKKQMWFAFTKNKFLEFCIQEGINPVGLSALTQTVSYLEDDSQDAEYGISVDEFRLFSQSLGFEVFSEIEYKKVLDTSIGLSQESERYLPKERAQPTLRKVIRSPEIQLSGLNRLKSLRSRFKVIRPLATPGASEDDFGDTEIDEIIQNKKKAQQEIIKKSTPGTLSKLRIRKLAVCIAWGIEVDTKRPASCVEVMTALCKMADSDDKPSWLVKPCRSTQLIWHRRSPAYAPFPRRSIANAACPARGF